MLTIACPQLLDDGRFDGPVAVSVDDGVVVAVEHRGPLPSDLVLDSGVLTAGMCDLQLNGAAGVDLSSAALPCRATSCSPTASSPRACATCSSTAR